MKQDEFTKSLKKILSLYGNEYREIAGKLTQKIFEHMQAGDSVARAYKKALKEIPFGKLNASAVEDAVYEAALKGYGVTAPDVFAGVEGEGALRHSLMEVAWNKDGMNLSTRLHGVNNVLHNNIKNTVQRSLNAYKTIRQTAKALYDGYGNPEDVLNEAELPKYLEKIKSLTTKLYSGDVQAAKESEIYKAAVHDLNKLKTPGMRAAYNDVVEAATSDSKSAERKARKMTKLGASQEEVDKMLAAEREKALNKALDVAAQEKTRYYAERIARTESARAYYEGQLAQAMNDEDVFGFQWRLSSAHVHEKNDCECYSYSEIDVGYGKGIFPKTEVPELPAHPNCMCHLKEVFVWQVKKTNGKDKLPEQNRGKNRVQEAAEEAKGLRANNEEAVEEVEPKAELIGTIDVKDTEKTLEWYEGKIVAQDHESAIIVSESGEVFRVEGGPANVNFAVVGKDKLNGASVTHNHPAAETHNSFSSYDVGEFFENGLKSLRGVDNEYIYEMRKTPETIIGTKQEIIYEHSGKYYAELLDMVKGGLVPDGFSIDTDGYHEIMNMIARDYKLEYRRTKR